MLTAEENELLTRVGPGTPCGELLRRYWHPVSLLADLTEASPTKFVRILGEDLVLFKDKSGRVGLLRDHCPHRGASLLYGRVEERGIACAYHGWLYDTEGNCLETPAEPADSRFYLTVKQRAYPVRERYGLYWAYMGPRPAPALLRWDALERGLLGTGGQRFDCNWLQVMENHMDQSHVFILHQDTAQRGVEDMSTARGRIDALEKLEYSEAPFGIRRKQFHRSGYIDADLMTFPNVQRVYNMFLINVPIDDTHTVRHSVRADIDMEVPTRSGNNSPDSAVGNGPGRTSSKTPPGAIHPIARYQMEGWGTQAQDLMALETQGPIADRTTERLATSDRGIELYRQVLRREIEKVQQGLDPIGVVRDPDHEPIDTDIQNWIEMTRRFPPQYTPAP